MPGLQLGQVGILPKVVRATGGETCLTLGEPLPEGSGLWAGLSDWPHA